MADLDVLGRIELPATIWANVVSCPWPWVCAESDTTALPLGITRRSAPSFIDSPRMSMCLRGPAPTPSVKNDTPMPISSPRERFSACSRRRSSGRQTRTFLHVDDLVAGLLGVMDKGRTCDVYNIGGSRQITIADLVRVAEQATGLNAEVVYTDHFIDDHQGRCPDTSKVEALGWQQTIPLAEGVRRSYRDMLAALSAETTEDTGDELRDSAAVLTTTWKPALVKAAAV